MLPPRLERFQRAVLLITALLFSAGYATVGLALVLIAVVAEGLITRRLPWRRSPVDFAFLAFVAVFLISGWTSTHRAVAVGSAGLAALTIYLAFGPLHRLLLRDPGFLGNLLKAWLVGGIAAALWAIFLHRRTGAPAFMPELGQNAVGTTLLIALVLCLGIFSTARTLPWRILAGAGSVPVAAGLAFTYTRGAWLGAAFGVLGFFVLTELRHTWRALLLVFLVGIAGAAFIGPERAALFQRMRSITNPSANQDRIFLFRSALRIFGDHPVLGTGLNTFSLVYPAYRSPDASLLTAHGIVPDPSTKPFAHNILLNMAAEGGTLGLLSFVAIVIAAVIAGWRWYAGGRMQGETVTDVTVLSAFLGAMVDQLFDGTMISVHLGTGMWFLVAILVAFGSGRRGSAPSV